MSDERQPMSEQTVNETAAGRMARLAREGRVLRQAYAASQAQGFRPKLVAPEPKVEAPALPFGEPDILGPLTVSRTRPRDTAKLLIARRSIEGVSRLRFQSGAFWWWNGGVYERQSDDAIRKLVGDFLYDARTADGEAFNPRKRDVDEVLNALEMEAYLEDRFAAPCWFPEGEGAGEWIVARNGLVNVRTGEMRAHTHRLWVHSALGFDWNAGAACPVFAGFLESIFPGDSEAQACLVEWLGLCMTLDTWPHKGMLLLGASRAGKSTIVRLAEWLVGAENFAPTSFDSWMRSELSPWLLIGKRVIAFSDVRLKQGQQYGKTYDAGGLPPQSKSLLLKITGADGVEFRKSHSQESWKGKLPGKVMIVSNEIPNFNDPVLPTRFLKLHFRINQEKAGKLNPFLGDQLKAELAGIAARCLVAYRQLCARGHFIQPESGLELERQLERAQHPHRAMVVECLEVSESEETEDWVVREDAWRACRAWLRENGHDVMATILRKEEMSDHFVKVFDHLQMLGPRDRWKQWTDGKRRWVRLRLTPEGRRLTNGEY